MPLVRSLLHRPGNTTTQNSTEEDSLAVGTDPLAMGAKTIVTLMKGIGIGLNTLVMADATNAGCYRSNARANHANSACNGYGSRDHSRRTGETDYYCLQYGHTVICR